jgi:hypothetical protein
MTIIKNAKEVNTLPNLRAIIFCRNFFLTHNKTESFLFANPERQYATSQTIRSVASTYFQSAKVKKIFENERQRTINLCIKFLNEEGYNITHHKINIPDKITNENIFVSSYDNIDDNNTKSINDNTKSTFRNPIERDENLKSNLLTVLISDFNAARDSDERVKLGNLIANMENLKKEDSKKEEERIIYYLPKRQCEKCEKINELLYEKR